MIKSESDIRVRVNYLGPDKANPSPYVTTDCGAPAPLVNGTVSTPNGTTYGQKGIYTCNQGYDLVVDNETTCLANITWSNAAPQCIAVGRCTKIQSAHIIHRCRSVLLTNMGSPPQFIHVDNGATNTLT